MSLHVFNDARLSYEDEGDAEVPRGGEGLEPTATAATVRGRGGSVITLRTASSPTRGNSSLGGPREVRVRLLNGTMLALLLLCTVGSPAASQQTARRGGAFVQAGATWSGLVDRNASDLRYTGPGAGPVVGWRGIRENYRIEVSVGASAGRLKSRVTSGDLNRESAASLDVRLGVLRRVWSLSAPELSVFAGGQIMVSGLGRIHHFPYGATEKFADIFGTLGAAGMWEYHGASDATLGGAVALPVASVVGRTPWYGLKDPPDFGFRGPRAGSVITHALWVEKPLSPRTSILIDYRTTLYRDADPRTFRRIEHRLATGIWLHRGNR